jgi:hypothetical protein
MLCISLRRITRRQPLLKRAGVHRLPQFVARMLEIKTTIHIDAATHQGNIDRGDPGAVSAVELGGFWPSRC